MRMLPFDPEHLAYQQKRAKYEGIDRGLHQALYMVLVATFVLSRGGARQWVFYTGFAVFGVLLFAWSALYWVWIDPLVRGFYRLPVKLDDTGEKPEPPDELV